MNDWLVFNTSKGKDRKGLVEAGASFDTSIRGFGQFNEDTKEIENYDFLGCDAVGNPSAGTFASKEQFKVTVESVEPRTAARIRKQLENTRHLDGVDAPRRHRCAKVVVLSNPQGRRPWARLAR